MVHAKNKQNIVVAISFVTVHEVSKQLFGKMCIIKSVGLVRG
jgi:hypothetical protein